VDAASLKQIWEEEVRGLLQVSGYRVSKSWAKTFESVAEFLDRHEEIDPREFARVQISHMLNGNKLDYLYPNIMSGDGAYARYCQRPSERDEELELIRLYATQGECFARVCQTLGEDFAFNNKVTEYSPLFFGFMCYQTKRELSPSLLADARAELLTRPVAKKMFPLAYIEEIQR
jgi:hypothetical protein